MPYPKMEQKRKDKEVRVNRILGETLKDAQEKGVISEAQASRMGNVIR